MAKTLTDLRANTRMYLDEAVAADWTNTDVDYAINYSYQDLASEVMQVYEQFYETTTPFTYALVANQQEYTIDSSIIKVTRIEVNLAPNIANSVPSKAVPIKMNESLVQLSSTSTGGNTISSVGYYIHGNLSAQKIGFIPLPTVSDTGNTKSISVWGITLPADLVNPTDAPVIPFVDNFAYLIGLRAAAMLLSKGQQDERSSTKYLGLYNTGVVKLKNFIQGRQSDGPEMVQEVYLENTDFSYPL